MDPCDTAIVAGGSFKQYPRHILSREVGEHHGDADQTAKPRGGYQVHGEFTGLPDLVERPVCGDCKVVAFPMGVRPVAAGSAGRIGVTRVTEADVTDLPREIATAMLLGLRVDAYLALVAAEKTFAPTGSQRPGGVPLAEEPPRLWPELHTALTAWHAANV